MIGHGDPQDPAWQGAGFDFGFGAAQRSLLVSSILDSSAFPLLYAYEGVPAHVPPTPDGGLMLGEEEQPPAPRLVGASDAPVPMGPIRGCEHRRRGARRGPGARRGRQS